MSPFVQIALRFSGATVKYQRLFSAAWLSVTAEIPMYFRDQNRCSPLLSGTEVHHFVFSCSLDLLPAKSELVAYYWVCQC